MELGNKYFVSSTEHDELIYVLYLRFCRFPLDFVDGFTSEWTYNGKRIFFKKNKEDYFMGTNIYT